MEAIDAGWDPAPAPEAGSAKPAKVRKTGRGKLFLEDDNEEDVEGQENVGSEDT